MRVDPSNLRATPPIALTRAPRSRAAKTGRVTVLFADLRGYTAMAERLPPASVIPLLDEFLRVLGRATTLHGGQIFHMAGDGMMAGFGFGDPVADGAREALAAGHAMLREFGAVAGRWRRDLSIETGIGVGLHLGEVALGSLGPPGNRRTTLVGDTVNVASRLCGRARAGEVLLSCTVAAALDAERARKGSASMPAAILQLPQFALRGRSEPLDIWCIPAQERVAL